MASAISPEPIGGRLRIARHRVAAGLRCAFRPQGSAEGAQYGQAGAPARTAQHHQFAGDPATSRRSGRHSQAGQAGGSSAGSAGDVAGRSRTGPRPGRNLVRDQSPLDCLLRWHRDPRVALDHRLARQGIARCDSLWSSRIVDRRALRSGCRPRSPHSGRTALARRTADSCRIRLARRFGSMVPPGTVTANRHGFEVDSVISHGWSGVN